MEFPGIAVAGEYTNSPTKFPYASIVETDNYIDSRYIDSSGEEKIARLMYEVNVYSNKEGVKKSECRKILNSIDKKMYLRNFVRLSMSPVPNLWDATIYRLNARYEGATDGEAMYRK